MPKRKRDEIESKISKIDDQSLRIKVSRLKARVEQGCTTLTAQLKLAKAFDRQKMSRRVKSAQNDQDKLDRLNAEIEVLKTLEPSKTAKNYLIKQMAKTTRIKSSPAFQTLYSKAAENMFANKISTAEGNVLGRLFKSNSVIEVVPGIMQGIRDVLNLDNEGTKSPHTRATSDGTKSQTRPDSLPTRLEESDISPEPGVSSVANTIDQDASDTTTANDVVLDEDVLQQLEVRIAASSDTGSVSNDSLDSMSITSIEDLSDSEEDGLMDVDSNQDASKSENYDKTEESMKPRREPKIAAPTNPSFLPSLTMGGYYSGGSSDEDDFDADADFKSSQPQSRKNRRGQRARQAIAEKKFGAKAQHLQKQSKPGSKDGQGQRTGWDAKRGAVDKSSRKSRIQQYQHDRKAGATSKASTGANAQAVSSSRLDAARGRKPQKEAGEKGMHPSWEAARKKKAEIKIGLGQAVGKKITFD